MATTTPSAAMKNGGWFSKFIDPAARLIVSAATRLFPSSIFGKNNINSIQEIPKATSTHQIRDQQRREDFVDIKLFFRYNGVMMSEEELSQRFDEIVGMQHLIQQKYFTKDEIDEWDKLIQSRIVERGSYAPLKGNQSKEEENGDSNSNSPTETLPIRRPTDFESTDMIRRPYCRSALCGRTSICSCKDITDDLIRPLKFRRKSLFLQRSSQFGYEQALKRSRSYWNAECSDDGRRRARHNSYLFRKSFRSFI